MGTSTTRETAAVGVLAVAMAVTAAGCAKPPVTPTQADESTRGLSICWRAPDEGDEATSRALLTALADRFKRAGYVLTPHDCTIQVSWAYSTRTIADEDSFREVKMAVRDAASDALIDAMTLTFGEGDMPSDEPDRLAITIVNTLNASPKVREYGREHGGRFRQTPDRPF